MLEIRSSLCNIDAKLDALSTQMDSVKSQIGVHEHRIDTLENKQSDFHEFQVDTKQQLSQMENLLQVIRAKNEDLEARLRHNNLRITGIPETTAITKMELFVSDMLRDLFADYLTPGFAVERAHRSLGPKPPVGGTPRPIIARILNYQDRDAVLKQARAAWTTTHQGNKIAFYPDFTPAVQAARREFLPAKKILLQAQIPSVLIWVL